MFNSKPFTVAPGEQIEVTSLGNEGTKVYFHKGSKQPIEVTLEAWAQGYSRAICNAEPGLWHVSCDKKDCEIWLKRKIESSGT